MKKFNKVILLVLSVAIILCGCLASFSSCKKNNSTNSEPSTTESVSGGNESTSTPSINEEDYEKYEKSRIEDALCYYNVENSSYNLIQNGANTGYTIVYPSVGDSLLKFAATELRIFIAEATGVTLPVKTDEEFTGKTKIISLGNTVQRKENQTVTEKLMSEDLKDCGFMLYSHNDSVYIMANSGSGVLWGAYEFLHLELNYEYFAENCYTLDKNVRNLNLKKLNVVDVPDIQFRVSGNGADYLNGTHMRRMKYNSYSDFYNLTDMAYMHNYFDIIPVETYAEDHPEWFSTEGTQLCFTRDPENLEKEVFKELKWRILADETRNYIPFHLNDGGGWCECSECTKNCDLYDDPTASYVADMIRFMNMLARDIKEWSKTEPALAGRDIKLVFISYGKLTRPPVKMDENKQPIIDENGNYIPYSEDLILEDNVVVQIACFANDVMDYSKDNDRQNASFQRVNRWKSVCSQFIFWTYSAMFTNYMSPFEIAGTRGDVYEILYNYGGLLIFDNSRYDTPYSSDWGSFEDYVYSQSMWNVRVDFEELKQKFFKNFFGLAADTMLEFYNDYRAYMYYLYNEKNQVFYIHGAPEYTSASNYPIGKIKYYLSFVDKAYQDIESLKSDPAEYDKYYTRILREGITWRYLEQYLFPETFSADAYAETRKQILADCYKCGITTGIEHGNIADMFM